MPFGLSWPRPRLGLISFAAALVAWSSLEGMSARAQLPQPRLSSLSRLGVRVGDSVDLTIRGTDLEGVDRLWFDHPGLTAAHVKDLTFRVKAAMDVPLGQHDVRATGRFGVSNPRTFVVGDRPEGTEVEPNNSPDRATPMAINGVVDGEISAVTEADCFSFEGRRGRRIFIDVQAERLESRLDATVRLIDPSGREIAESRDVFGADPFMDLTLPTDGRYVVKVHDATYSGSADHLYRLTIHDGPHLDAILPLASPRGSSGPFTLIGRGLGQGAVTSPQLRADDRPLERIGTSITIPGPDRGPWPRLAAPAQALLIPRGIEYSYTRIDPLGTVPLSSNPMPIGEATGPVVLEHEPNDDVHAQDVSIPCDISGTFGSPGDVDIYRFAGRKGEVWRIEAVAERLGSPADPTLLVQRVVAKGQPQDLASGDDLADTGAGARFNTQSVDAEVRLTVPEDGTYQVQVNDLYSSQRGDPRLTYRLVIRREKPDFRLVLLSEKADFSDSVNLRPGGRAVASVLAVRIDGFAGPILVEAVELPPGLKCPPVVIAHGQVLAPIVLEAAENARPVIGPVSLVGRAWSAGGKEIDVGRTTGTPAPDLVHQALAGGMTAPANATVKTMAPARLFRGFVVSILGDPAPLQLTARPEAWVVAQGRQVILDLAVARRAGFAEAVSVSTPELPPNVAAATSTIPKDSGVGTLSLFVPKSVPPGTYSIVLRGAGPFPFSKDAAAKQKPNVTLTEPSNPVILTVRTAPLNLAVDGKGGALKQGQRLEIEVTAGRQDGFAGEVSLALVAPGTLKLSAVPTALGKGQAKGKLVVQAAKDTPVGAAAGVVVRATVKHKGETVLVDEPLALNISK